MWEIMKNNGYQKKHKETKQIASKGKQKEERNDEWRWYGLTSIGRYTEKLKCLMRMEGIKTYRKGGDKLESKVKESTNNKKKAKEQSKKEEEGVIYKIKCKDCHMIYIGEKKNYNGKENPTTQKRYGIWQNGK